MKTKLLLLLGLLFAMQPAFADAMGDKSDESLYKMRPQFCARDLSEQIKEDVSLVSVRVTKTLGGTPELASGYCYYEIDVIDRLYEQFRIPSSFAITEESPVREITSCHPVGSEFLVLLTNKSTRVERIRCSTSAIYSEDDREKLLKLLTQK